MFERSFAIMNYKLHIASFFVLIFSIHVFAQVPKNLHTTSKKASALFEEALRYFQSRNDEKARQVLIEAINEDAKFFEALNLLGDIYKEKKDHKQAVEYYTRAIEVSEEIFPRLLLNCSESHFQLEQYDEVVKLLTSYEKYKKSKSDELLTNQLMSNARFAKKAKANPVSFTPINLGKSINSELDEYHPTLTIDGKTLLFTRMVLAERKGFQEDFYQSIWQDNQWLPAIPVGAPLNTDLNEGTPHLSADGRTLLFTICNKNDGFGSCDIYASAFRNGKWSAPVNMGETINSSFWDSQPSLSADGKTIMFTSKRSGGKGAADLWVSRREAGGYWQMAENAGDSINTPYDDEAPFMHPDGKTLYFASKGHEGLGGFDLFVSRLRPDGKWGKPENIGYPINSPKNELQLMVTADGKRAFYSSARTDGLGGQDIYSFELPQMALANPVTYFSGKIIDKNTRQPLKASFSIVNLKEEKQSYSSESDAVSGKFLIAIPAGNEYGIYAENQGYLFYSENVNLTQFKGQTFEKTIELIPIAAGEKVVMNNVFFEVGSAKLSEKSNSELNKLIKLLQVNPSIKIEIGGHTDDTGDEKANITLSENRAKAVYDYLIEKGIQISRLSFKGYGKSLPVADNKTSEGRAQNRRTEIKIL